MSGIKLEVTAGAVFYTVKVLKGYPILRGKTGALKSNCELSKVGTLMTEILGILSGAAHLLSLESLVHTFPPYGEWNTCIVFTLFHRASSIGVK